jgi:hypothetical protein
MRASRAYIAGFGTAGSLLAGAAMLFVLASAVVAFKGWPQVADQPTPTAVIVAQRQAPLDEHAIHRLQSAGAAVTGATVTAAAPSSAQRVVASTSTSPAPSPSIHVASTGTRQADRTTHAETGSANPTAIAPAPHKSAPPTLAQTVNNTTGTLGRTVAGAGNAVASTVTGLTNALAKTVSGLSPGLGQTVKRTGDLLGSAVSGTTGVVGGLLSGTGQALGQLLRGHR